MTYAKVKRVRSIDPKHGVAPVSVATSYGQPGGRHLTEEDVREFLIKGSSFDELAALQLTSRARLEEIVKILVAKGTVPSERFDFIR